MLGDIRESDGIKLIEFFDSGDEPCMLKILIGGASFMLLGRRESTMFLSRTLAKELAAALSEWAETGTIRRREDAR